MFKYLSLMSLLITSFAFGAEESKKSEEQAKLVDASMVQIKRWKDVTPFTGKIVAYKATSYYFASSVENRCPINTDTSFIYGYVHQISSTWRTPTIEEGYEVNRLLKPEACASVCAFTDTYIQKDSVQMRCATAEERSKISEALKAKRALFEYIHPDSKLLKKIFS